MNISISGLGKKFNRRWLFRNLEFEISSYTAIVGPNGSGKSTLLQLLSGATLPSEGQIEWASNGIKIPPEEQYAHLAIAAPYMELIEDFTLREQLHFHFRFKKIRQNKSIDDLLSIGYFDGEEEKPVRQFSSGMKQRLKLLLAFYSDVPVVLLDEPTTNLDENGVAWYLQQIDQLDIPTVIVASNQPNEYSFSKQKLDIRDYKV